MLRFEVGETSLERTEWTADGFKSGIRVAGVVVTPSRVITSHWLRGPAEKAELGRWTEGREGGSWTYAKIAETNRSGRLDLSSDGRLALLRHHVDVRGKNLGEVWYVGEFPPAPRRR